VSAWVDEEPVAAQLAVRGVGDARSELMKELVTSKQTARQAARLLDRILASQLHRGLPAGLTSSTGCRARSMALTIPAV
jgi:hypothetical protein